MLTYVRQTTMSLGHNSLNTHQSTDTQNPSQDLPTPNFVDRKKTSVFDITEKTRNNLLRWLSRKHRIMQSFYYNIYFSIEGTYNTERKKMIGTESAVRIKMTTVQQTKRAPFPVNNTAHRNEAIDDQAFKTGLFFFLLFSVFNRKR